MEDPIADKISSSLVLRIGVALTLLVICGFGVAAAAHDAGHGHSPHHHCNHGHHGHDHHHQHDNHGEEEHQHDEVTTTTTRRRTQLPEELAEEEDLKLFGFGGGGYHQHDHHHHLGVAADAELSGLGLWIHAMGCSLLVSLASLICLVILPLIFIQGKPSKAIVDSLALFGAGAMLGDAFLHQLPHAFGGEHSHSHDYNMDHSHMHDHSGHGHFQSHAHSLKDLSVGLSILAGIILFLIVEKLVRYVEDSSGGMSAWTHSHHHHPHKKSTTLKTENESHENLQGPADDKQKKLAETLSKEEVVDGVSNGTVTKEAKRIEHDALRKRNTGKGATKDKTSPTVTENEVVANGSKNEIKSKEEAKSSNLVFGYLNLFSDGVHNFTDGMALGSAFLLYGSVGGWSRTLFLLAHELPQEIGDFGILVRSGFSVSKALFFNFLSALVALAGTALALMWGQDPGHSSLIEGFTAGGFIYIAVAGVLAEMNNGRVALQIAAGQIVSLVAGMAVALCISLVE